VAPAAKRAHAEFPAIDKKKIAQRGLIAIVAIAVVPLLLPLFEDKPVSFDRVESAFAARGLVVHPVVELDPPGYDAVANRAMFVGEASVCLYRFDETADIPRQTEAIRNEPYAGIVDAWTLGGTMGAPPDPDRLPPHRVVRNDDHVMLVVGYDATVNDTVVQVFSGL